MNLPSPDIAAVLSGHGIPCVPHVTVLDLEAALPSVRRIVGEQHVSVVHSPEDAVKCIRSHRVVAPITSGPQAGPLVRALSVDNVTAAVLAHEDGRGDSDLAQLRAAGAMDVFRSVDMEELEPLIRRALDFSALLTLELAHRCESRRLLNRELELLGQPPEGMSDDLSVFQPPPLPVGPMSVYDLDEASDAFETAYIDRVRQLCASAREAAVYLGVSSATLSRRLRREASDAS